MKSKGTISQKRPKILVRSLSARSTRGVLAYGNLSFPCVLGRSGRRAAKREGDGATPIGAYALRDAFYRPDRQRRPTTGLKLARLRPEDGWCDAANDRNYNRPVQHPYPASAERMWREDRLYDLVVVLGYNDRPRVAGRGSAVFMHVAAPDLTPTEGCVALKPGDLRKLLKALRPNTVLKITS